SSTQRSLHPRGDGLLMDPLIGARSHASLQVSYQRLFVAVSLHKGEFEVLLSPACHPCYNL
ncbi:MAG: hypothetical protein M1396_02020, partial [Chloroflexi bacterium]|nr:hypothetical protein [Chloroflexota bacterium]